MVLAAIICMSIVEIAATSRSYGGDLTAAHWTRASELLRADTPLVIGTSWLSPEARMRIDAAGIPEASGRPDLRGVASFDVLRDRRAGPSSETRWQALLARDSQPTRASIERAGPLLVEHWNVERAERIVDGLTYPRAPRIKIISDAERTCRGNPATGYECPGQQGASRRIQEQYAEIDYEPRRCLSIPLQHAASVSLLHPNFERGDRIVGHLGFEDFNARLRNDGPITMTIQVAGETVARSTFTNADGWAGFEFPTTPGAGPLTVSLHANAPGRWASDPERYARSATRRVCLELRALRREDPE